jgi:VanZ family protein
MKNIKVVRVIFFLLLMATFAVIFCFSSENGKKSGNTSRGVMRTIIDHYPQTKHLDEEQKEKIVEDAQPIIRKLAHFGVYTLAGINLMGFWATFRNLRKIQRVGLAFGCGVIYAITDELHQLFSAGRTARIFDVGVDSLGVLFGIGIVNFVLWVVFKAKNKTKVSEHEIEGKVS